MKRKRIIEIHNFAISIRNYINELAPNELDDKVNIYYCINLLQGRVNLINNKTFSDVEINKITDDYYCFELKYSNYKNEGILRYDLTKAIGHLFLHMGYLINASKWTSVKNHIYNSTYEDAEAHEFASVFLMPKNKFYEISEKFKNNNKYKIKKIANHFGVLVSVASNRGKKLGIFK